MANVILQPASDPASGRNLEATIFNPVPPATLKEFLPSSVTETLDALTEGSALHLWGAKPGEDGRNVKRWDRIAPGDTIFFALGRGAAGANLAVTARVVYKFRSPEMARALWGKTETANGFEQTWELAFAVDSITRREYDKAAFNLAIDREANADIREFVVLRDDQSTGALEYLQIPASAASPPSTADPGNYSRRRRPTPGDAAKLDVLDRYREVLQREEQGLLRRYMLNGETGTCALCERTLPVAFLVAAHIKKRSDCTDAEKRDIQNVAMPACKLGCDELFERKMVAVDDTGTVRILGTAPETGDVRAYVVKHLEGRAIKLWQVQPDSRPYFAHHYRVALDSAGPN